MKKREIFADCSFSVVGSKLWNSLPDYLKLSPTIDTFKKDLKTHLLDKLLTLQLPNHVLKSIQLVIFTITITLNYIFIYDFIIFNCKAPQNT